MKVEIQRFDPDTNRKWVDTFDVDTSGRSMTVMDVLEEISVKMDNTLAFYKHSVCNHGICVRCTVLVNGKPRLACTEIVSGLDEVSLAPLPGRNLVRDLVTRR